MAIRILVADDHRLFREGLINLLRTDEDMQVIEEADDGISAFQKASQLLPDIILTDIVMPEMSGTELTRKIKQEYPKIKIIVLSMHSESRYVQDLLQAGADGYLLKNCNIRQLIGAIKSVHSGKKYLSDELTSMVIKGYLIKEKKRNHSFEQLSSREKEIFQLLAQGSSPKEISDQLFISIKTVATHKQNILEKLNLQSNSDIIRYALKKNLINI